MIVETPRSRCRQVSRKTSVSDRRPRSASIFRSDVATSADRAGRRCWGVGTLQRAASADKRPAVGARAVAAMARSWSDASADGAPIVGRPSQRSCAMRRARLSGSSRPRRVAGALVPEHRTPSAVSRALAVRLASTPARVAPQAPAKASRDRVESVVARRPLHGAPARAASRRLTAPLDAAVAKPSSVVHRQVD